MAVNSKDQQAALLRIKEICADIRSALSYRPWCFHDRGIVNLNRVEEGFNGYQEEVAALVKTYGLNPSPLIDFKRDMAQEIYEEAGKRRNLDWQSLFAKRHGIKAQPKAGRPKPMQ